MSQHQKREYAGLLEGDISTLILRMNSAGATCVMLTIDSLKIRLHRQLVQKIFLGAFKGIRHKTFKGEEMHPFPIVYPWVCDLDKF